MPSDLSLIEIDSLEIQVIIDNELDPLSQPAPDTVHLAGGTMPLIALSTSPALQPGERGNAVKEFRMEDICCSAHGLSIMIVCFSRLILRNYAYNMNRLQPKVMSKGQYYLIPGPKSKHGKEMSIDSKQIYPRLT